MHAAVLVISMPSAIEVPAVWVAMHVAPVALAARRNVHLAVLMVPMPIAVEVPAMRVPMHVAMMMTMPVIPVDVDFLRLMHDPILGRAERSQWCRLGGCDAER